MRQIAALPLVRGTVAGRTVLDAQTIHIADLQIEEDDAPGGPPITKMHQKFAGMTRWLLLEQALSGGE